MSPKFTPEQLVAGLELDARLHQAAEYDKAEAAKGVRYGYTPDYSFGLNALGGVPGANSDGHFTDAGKLPSHPTFSDEAVLGLGNPKAGHWIAREQAVDGMDTFYPSAERLKEDGYLDNLQYEFSKSKGHGMDKVVVPPPYKNIEQ